MALISLIDPENYVQEVILEQKPTLILCMPQDEKFSSQMELIQNSAPCFEGFKFALITETFIETFNQIMGACGTPTFLVTLHGEEINRMIGVADQNMLDDFLKQSFEKIRRHQIYQIK